MNRLTLDDGQLLKGHAMFYVAERIGDKRSFTPEGFLLCQDVPLARTGEMLYGPGETPLKVGDSGYLICERSEDQVFRPEFMASFEGKPVVNDHPRDPQGVTPHNWRKLAVGTVINPRRGVGDLANFIVADLLITDVEAIRCVMEDKKREVSAGYEAEYEQLKPGRGRQYDMIANHVALVNAGRCGSRCSIGDEQTQGEDDMRAQTNDHATTLDQNHPIARWWDGVKAKVKDAFAKKDETALNEILNKAPTRDDVGTGDGEEHIHVHAGGRDEEAHGLIAELQAKVATFDALMPKLTKLVATVKDENTEEEDEEAKKKRKEAEDSLEEEANEADKDKARKATDSSFLADSFQEAAAGAEILVPGISIGTFDKALEPTKTLDQVCKLRRNALDLAYSQPAGRTMIEQLHGKKLNLDKMACRDVRVLFRSAVATKKAVNGVTVSSQRATQDKKNAQPIKSIADLNARNRERYVVKPH